MQTKTKMKNENKNESGNKNKNENENEYENQNEFSFLFSFCLSFSFLVLLSKSFCIFVNSTWPRGAIHGQLSLVWPRSAIAFSFANLTRGLAVKQMVNSLLIGLEVPQQLEIWHLASFEYLEFNDTVLMMNFNDTLFCFRPKVPFLGTFGPKNQNCQFKAKLVATLIRICRIQSRCSLFPLSTGNTPFGQIWSKMSKLSF